MTVAAARIAPTAAPSRPQRLVRQLSNVVGAHRAQSRAHRPRAAAAVGRHDPTGAVHGPVRLRLRRRRGASPWRHLRQLRDRRHARAQLDDLGHGDRRRAQQRPQRRHHRPLPVAADVAAGDTRRPVRHGPVDRGDLHFLRLRDGPARRLAPGGQRRARPSPASRSSCSSATRSRGAVRASASSPRAPSRPRASGSSSSSPSPSSPTPWSRPSTCRSCCAPSPTGTR